MFSKKNFFFFFALLIGGILRFSYLPWGQPYFFHPDENNITLSILQLSLRQWNPHFFAYGGFPIYITFLLSQLITWGKPTFASIAYTLRFLSASLSFLLIPSLAHIGWKMFGKSVGIIAALLASVGVGVIQFAHFGTFEMWLTFFSLWFFYACFLFWKNPSTKHALFASLLTGILLSIKVSSVVFIPIPFIILLLKIPLLKYRFIFVTGIFALVVSLFYLVTNPFLFLDTNSFISALQYESSVAIGTLPVFYTQTFLHTTPLLFQLQYVFPFLLNPIIFILFLVSFFILLLEIVRKKKSQDSMLVLFFLITFLSQALLFVKWTRYMVPTLPFIYLSIGILIGKMKPFVRLLSTFLLYAISCIFAVAFFLTVYPHDSRIEANAFAKNHILSQKVIMEPYDLGAIAFTAFPDAKIINLYDLETNPEIQNQLTTALSQSTLFISPSQRLIHARLQDPMDFPQGNVLYKNLFNRSLGFHVVYQTPCNTWCHLVYMGNPLTQGEDTASVFDHPIVTIFEK